MNGTARVARTETRLRLRIELDRAGIRPGEMATDLGLRRPHVSTILGCGAAPRDGLRARIAGWARGRGIGLTEEDLFSPVRIAVRGNGQPLPGGSGIGRRGSGVEPRTARPRLAALLDEKRIGGYGLALAAGVPRSSLQTFLSGGTDFLRAEHRAAVARCLVERYGVRAEEIEGAWENDGNWISRIGDREAERLGDLKMLDHEVLAHFGLRRDPFTAEIASGDDLYVYAGLRRAENQVLEAAARKAFAAVVGPVGIGKTLLRKRVQAKLAKDHRYRVLVPQSPSREIIGINSVEESLILAIAPKSPCPGTIERRSRRLIELLEAAAAAEEIVVVMLDEAHAFPTRTIRAFKRLLELAGFERLCGIILWGQPELGELLDDPSLREVGKRCRRIELAGLAKNEVEKYLEWKLARAGAGRTIFDGGAIAAMTRSEKRSGIERMRMAAVPLDLGRIAARAMEVAFAAASARVGAEHVEAVF